MSDETTDSDPAETLAALQDSLYDLSSRGIAQARPHERHRLHRDAHEAPALAEELASLANPADANEEGGAAARATGDREQVMPEHDGEGDGIRCRRSIDDEVSKPVSAGQGDRG